MWMDSTLPENYKINADADVEHKIYPFGTGHTKFKAFVWDTTQHWPYTVQLTAPAGFKYGFKKMT